jgi:alpha-glucosidase
MKKRYLVLMVSFLIGSSIINAQKNKVFDTKSPDSNISLHIESGTKLLWSVQLKGQQIIAPSAISLQLQDDEVLGDNAKISSSHSEKIDSKINSINYKKSIISDQYNQLTINCKGDYGVIFRVYNDGVAYRFFIKRKTEIIIKNEEADFNFPVDHKAYIPYSRDYHKTRFFNYSCFEAGYSVCNISQFGTDSLALLPLLVDIGDNKKIVILEADLEDYPGMYLNVNQTLKGFLGVFPPYPLETKNPDGDIYMVPTKVAGYIARTNGTRSFPWRAIVISQSDKDLLNNDMVQKLASPSRITDVSWIQPGQVAWDWWNDLNLSHVDFKAGVNNPTFKYYIDFASANKIKYIILDGWWSESLDLFKVNPNLNIQEIVDYGKAKGVGVILWAAWYTVTQQMEKAFPFYSKMGVKGFKIDFVDRDDQLAVASLYEIAAKAAENHLLVDYHGVFKPTGLQRTYPNVVGFEGVKGMENYKWAPIEDAPFNAVSIPFIRMIAGPMDYTPGAMKNAAKGRFWPLNASPMAMGTRCNQMAMYVVYEAPLQMLSDNPTIYMKEQECTDFITSVPTTFDETVALDGKVGEYAALARRKGDTWYAGAMSNWVARDLTIDFSFLGEGKYEAIIFKDGINADREGTDYKKEVIKITASDKLNIHLAPGGGWASRIRKIN